MTDPEFEELKKRGDKAGRLGYEARAVIDELVHALTVARDKPKPKPRAKAKKVGA
jgi:hypothetical protein